MSRLKAREKSQAGYATRFLPAGVTNWTSINGSTQFGPFKAGELVEVVTDVAAHVNAANSVGSAGTTNPKYPAGPHGFTVPYISGVEDVYVYLNSNGAGGSGSVFKSSNS